MKKIGTYRSLLLMFGTFVKNNEHFVYLDNLIKCLKESEFKEFVKDEREVELALDKLYRHNVISDVVSEKGDLHINMFKKEAEKICLRFEDDTNKSAKKIFDNYRGNSDVYWEGAVVQSNNVTICSTSSFPLSSFSLLFLMGSK